MNEGLGALNNYRGINLQGAGMGLNTAGNLFGQTGSANIAAAGADRGVTSSLAGGLGNLIGQGQSDPYADLFRQYGLTIGGMRV